MDSTRLQQSIYSPRYERRKHDHHLLPNGFLDNSTRRRHNFELKHPFIMTVLLLLHITNYHVPITFAMAQDNDKVLELITMPPGCTCLSSSSSSSSSTHSSASTTDCESFDCKCSCDLTMDACDIDCCCDDDCYMTQSDDTNNQRQDSESLLYPFMKCHAETMKERQPIPSTSSSIHMCHEIPSKYEQLTTVGTPESAIHPLLCVQRDNSAVRGRFYTPDMQQQTMVPSSRLSTSLSTVTNQNSFAHVNMNPFTPGSQESTTMDESSSGSSTTTSSSSTSGSHTLNYFIPIYKPPPTTSTENYMYMGNLELPGPSDGGLCLDDNAIVFGQDLQQDCWRVVQDWTVDCQGILNIDRFTLPLYVTKGPRDDPVKDSTTKDSLIPIEMETVLLESSYNTEYSTAVVDMASNQNISDETIWDETSNVCFNALEKVHYHVWYNRNDGSLERIQVQLMYTHIPRHSQRTIFRQQFQVTFTPMISSDDNDNDAVLVKKSGNPGYIFGLPTLAGRKNHQGGSSITIEQSILGLAIMDTGIDGDCQSASNSSMTVGFGEDMTVSCSLSLTKNELADLCSLSNHFLLSQYVSSSGEQETMYIPRWLLQEDNDVVGIFGNADPLVEGHWLDVDSVSNSGDGDIFSVRSRVWIDSESRCDGLVTGLHYRIFWTHVGNVDRPQAKIVRVTREYDSGNALKHILSSEEVQQSFQFTTTVSWEYLNPDNVIEKSPPPTFLFSVPHDLFYPFETGSSQALRCPIVLISILSMFLVLMGE